MQSLAKSIYLNSIGPIEHAASFLPCIYYITSYCYRTTTYIPSDLAT
eukprot:COSAG02_NODE_6113_length_3790_cov_6.285559_4_plen_47_part_00